jgi:ribA/ribD-fused uncharacterized protein
MLHSIIFQDWDAEVAVRASDAILSFDGEYRFLSNFFPAVMTYCDLTSPIQPPQTFTYETVEHAFQSLKATNEVDAATVRNARTAGEAKRAGRRIDLRPDWEKVLPTNLKVKDQIMLELVWTKFLYNGVLTYKLLATENRILVEGNTWHDTYWGFCNGQGINKLGQIIMHVRELLRSGAC